jgi:flavin-dependent dehydrogenase
LDKAVNQLGGNALHRLKLGGWGHLVSLSLPGGISISRSALDATLVNSALAVGVEFRSLCHAEVGETHDGFRSVILGSRTKLKVMASLVIDASGLGDSFVFDSEPERVGCASSHRIGCSAILDHSGDSYESGTIHMAIGIGGYVGVVRVEGDRLNVAAALDPDLIRLHGVGAAVRYVLDAACFEPIPGLDSVPWKGTPPMMQEPKWLAKERLFAIGDASGYVEPFTGEGIGWAIHSATLLAPLALEAIKGWNPSMAADWMALRRGELVQAQRDCRWFAWALRHPFIARGVLRSIESMPVLGEPLIRRLHGSPISGATTT